jgi:hypothetical protein
MASIGKNDELSTRSTLCRRLQRSATGDDQSDAAPATVGREAYGAERVPAICGTLAATQQGRGPDACEVSHRIPRCGRAASAGAR